MHSIRRSIDRRLVLVAGQSLTAAAMFPRGSGNSGTAQIGEFALAAAGNPIAAIVAARIGNTGVDQ